MLDFLRDYWLAFRRWPVYSILTLLMLIGFGRAGWRGVTLLGIDSDNANTESASGGSAGNSLTGRGGSHHGHGTFYHK